MTKTFDHKYGRKYPFDLNNKNATQLWISRNP